MTHHRLRTFRTVLSTGFAVFCIAGLSHMAMAQSSTVPAGCDPKLMKLQQTRAAAKVCADIAMTEQMTDKPDSVLATSCFAKSAAVSAKEGGKIFSDKDSQNGFKDKLKDIIDPFLKKWLGTSGSDGGNFANAAGLCKISSNIPGCESNGNNNNNNNNNNNSNTGLEAGYHKTVETADGDDSECTAVDEVWKAEQDKGINLKVPPLVTDAQLRSDTAPKCRDGDNNETDCGQDFKDAWKACADQGVFKAYKDAYDAVHPPTVPDFSNDTSSCKVLETAGITQGANCQ